jgi:hypothetical protein
LIVLIAAVLTSARALATPPLTVALDYDVSATTDTCPDEAVFRALVAGKLGYDPFLSGSSIRVLVRAEQSESGTEGKIEWKDASGSLRGEQRFSRRNQGCTRLMNEMGFALAVQIELLGTTGGSAPEAPTEPVPAAPEVSRTAPSVEEHAPSTSGQETIAASGSQRSLSRWSALVGAGPALDIDLAPTPTASAHLFVELQYGYISAELGGGASLYATEHQPDGTGFREFAVTGELGLCGHLDRFALCGLGEFGSVSVRGFGVDQSGTPSGMLARTGIRLRITQPIGTRFSASLRADGLILVTPWTVDLNHAAAWTMPTLGSVLGIDVTGRFL